jgi:hypothetical protein
MVENALQRGKAEGRVEGRVETQHEDIISVLAARCGDVPQPVREQVMQITDLARLRELLYAAATVPSLEGFAPAPEAATGA